MHDIVIPYSRNNSGELETCLALIGKNFPHRNIHVVEEFDNRTYHTLPHINQILKLKWAIENLDLTEEFYLFNDDFFVLEPVNSTPYYHKGSLRSHISSRPRDVYTRALETTASFLPNAALSYEMHMPFLFNKGNLYALIMLLDSAITSGKCPLIRSTYGNLFNVGGHSAEDVKNIKDYVGKTYLSTTESTFKRDIGDYIRSKL